MIIGTSRTSTYRLLRTDMPSAKQKFWFIGWYGISPRFITEKKKSKGYATLLLATADRDELLRKHSIRVKVVPG